VRAKAFRQCCWGNVVLILEGSACCQTVKVLVEPHILLYLVTQCLWPGFILAVLTGVVNLAAMSQAVGGTRGALPTRSATARIAVGLSGFGPQFGVGSP
jgi:hypothetical protein